MSNHPRYPFAPVLALLTLPLFSGTLQAQEDPYETYVKTSKDFKCVKQDKDYLYKAYPSWEYFTWYYQWEIGYDDNAGKFCQETGYNGGFADYGNPEHLDWFKKFDLRFYVDHAAGKGYLKTRSSQTAKPKNMLQTAKREPMLDDALKDKLKGLADTNIKKVIESPMRAVYALDDEISWGSYVKPSMWQITDEANYRAWLEEIYGKGKAPANPGWIGYDDIREKISTWSLGEFDASQLMDQWTFNDSWWNNFIGDLVEHVNTIDPELPCGFVGGQCPSAFGYDYAKIMRKIQFIEAYNLGGNQSIIRSFSPKNAIPAVTTHFHKNSGDTIWQMWYYVAHGNRGHVGWVEKWFDEKTKEPKSFHKEIAPTLLEIGKKIGPLQAQSEWIHDGVGIYYSQASIQMSWILDAQANGKNGDGWMGRNGGSEHKRGTANLVRLAWENMLRDEGLQYNFLSYADVIQNGIPKDYKVVILPAVYCLSDAEAKRLKEFVDNGGTIIADFMPGLWDQHGKGRKNGGALDALFGVKHPATLKASDLFGGRWFDDQAASKTTQKPEASGYNKAVLALPTEKTNKVGKGAAVYMNLSPQYYNGFRSKGFAEAKKRETFMMPIKAAGVKRWVDIQGASDKEFCYEITYWKKGDRTILFVSQNAEVDADAAGGGWAAGLRTDDLDITLKFEKAVSDVKDERTGKSLGSGSAVKVHWKQNEAAVISFK